MRPRDLEALYDQYSKLRHKLLREEMSRFAYKDSVTGKIVYDKAEVDDLKSYIDYQFIKLVKEYDPNSAVDFPAYIKSKLTLRTRHSYIKRYYSHYYRTHDLQKDNNKLVEETLHDQSMDNWLDNQDSALVHKVLTMELMPVEKDIINTWLQPPVVRESSNKVPPYNPNNMVYQLLKRKYPEYSKSQFINLISKLRKKLQKELAKENECYINDVAEPEDISEK